MIDGSAVPSTPEDARKVQAIILTSLPIGVTLFAAVALWVRRDAPATEPGPLLSVWLIGTVMATLAAVMVWQRMVRPSIPVGGQRANAPGADVLGRLHTGQIICMALMEGMALLGGVILILSGVVLPAVAGVVMTWGALAILWPRRGWYGLR